MLLSFSVSPLDAWSAVADTSWDFGDGQTGIGQQLTHTYARPGTYPVSVTSTDALGNPTTTTGSIVIVPAPGSPGASGPAGAVAAPALSRVSRTHRTWREDTRKAMITARRPPIGTTFSFSVDQLARVTLVFTQRLAGRRVAGKCLAPTRANRDHVACPRTTTRGSLSYTVRAGAHRVPFQGRITGRGLPLGPYTVTLTADQHHDRHSLGHAGAALQDRPMRQRSTTPTPRSPLPRRAGLVLLAAFAVLPVIGARLGIAHVAPSQRHRRSSSISSGLVWPSPAEFRRAHGEVAKGAERRRLGRRLR